MKRTPYFSWLLGSLAMAFCLTMSLGLVQEASAGEKAKFRYRTPTVNGWVKYCDRRHAEEPLPICCDRRIVVCQSRCKKSRFPNTSYASKHQCMSACKQTGTQCMQKAKDRFDHGRSTVWEPKDNPWFSGFYDQCRKRHGRRATKVESCCGRKSDQCESRCKKKYKRNSEKLESCSNECSSRYEICSRKLN